MGAAGGGWEQKREREREYVERCAQPNSVVCVLPRRHTC